MTSANTYMERKKPIRGNKTGWSAGVEESSTKEEGTNTCRLKRLEEC